MVVPFASGLLGFASFTNFSRLYWKCILFALCLSTYIKNLIIDADMPTPQPPTASVHATLHQLDAKLPGAVAGGIWSAITPCPVDQNKRHKPLKCIRPYVLSKAPSSRGLRSILTRRFPELDHLLHRPMCFALDRPQSDQDPLFKVQAAYELCLEMDRRIRAATDPRRGHTDLLFHLTLDTEGLVTALETLAAASRILRRHEVSLLAGHPQLTQLKEGALALLHVAAPPAAHAVSYHLHDLDVMRVIKSTAWIRNLGASKAPPAWLGNADPQWLFEGLQAAVLRWVLGPIRCPLPPKSAANKAEKVRAFGRLRGSKGIVVTSVMQRLQDHRRVRLIIEAMSKGQDLSMLNPVRPAPQKQPLRALHQDNRQPVENTAQGQNAQKVVLKVAAVREASKVAPTAAQPKTAKVPNAAAVSTIKAFRPSHVARLQQLKPHQVEPQQPQQQLRPQSLALQTAKQVHQEPRQQVLEARPFVPPTSMLPKEAMGNIKPFRLGQQMAPSNPAKQAYQQPQQRLQARVTQKTASAFPKEALGNSKPFNLAQRQKMQRDEASKLAQQQPQQVQLAQPTASVQGAMGNIKPFRMGQKSQAENGAPKTSSRFPRAVPKKA